MKNSDMTPKVKAAFDHVRGIFPGITHVLYETEDWFDTWVYMHADGTAPYFDTFDVDIGLLEDALDEVAELHEFPCQFGVSDEKQ